MTHGSGSIFTDRSQIVVALAKGVIHFVEHRAQIILGIVAVVDGQGIKDVAKYSREAKNLDSMIRIRDAGLE